MGLGSGAPAGDRSWQWPRLKTLLVVDDDQGMRDTLAAILKRDYRRAGGRERGGRRWRMLRRGQRGPDAARRAPARDERSRSAAHREGAVRAARGHRHLGVSGSKPGHGHQERRVSLHHERLRLRHAALARANASERRTQSPRDHAVGAGGQQGARRVITGPSQAMRLVMDTVQARRAHLGDRPDPRRERHRQGMLARLIPPRSRPQRRAVHPRQPRAIPSSWSKARSSATRRARSPARCANSSEVRARQPAARWFLDDIGDLRYSTCR